MTTKEAHLSSTRKARVLPGRSHYGRRKKMDDFATVEQRLLAEIRDLLLVLVNRPDMGVAMWRVTDQLGNEVEALRKVVERQANPSMKDALLAQLEADEAEVPA